ncbi:PTS transporter subunit EIIC [Collinsella vaginalis]|uniref:PTS transporter subunit EIIC n=1 Tax=Collinsella vaginalis TaxID=1870987 RepID=UPI000A270BC6|nr:PTS transporter subunit EIIC [Collinsella vaginalis]
MADYRELAAFVIKNVGGRENVQDVTHCLTRLRFKLNDEDLVDEDALLANGGIVTAQRSGGRYQVVIGSHVDAVYKEVIHQLGIEEGVSAPVDSGGSILDRLTAIITQTIAPTLGVLGGTALITGLMALLVAAGVIVKDSGEYLLLNALGSACLTFFPVILGYTSARAFGLNPFIGMILGCALVFPDLASGMGSGEAIYTLLPGTPLAMPVYKTFFSIPILFPSTGYTSTVIPIIFATYLASIVERNTNKIMPQKAQMFLTPAVTVLVAGVISVLIVGPVSIMLTNLISWGINVLLDTVPVIAYIVFAFVYQPLVILGLHWALISVGIMELMGTGSTLLIGLIFPASFAHLAVCAAIAMRSKSERMREMSVGAVVSACFCIIEPSIYGVTLPVKKRFGICMVAGTIGAVISGLTGTRMFALTMGVTGFAGFIDPATGNASSVMTCIIAVAVTMVVAFVAAWLSYRPLDDGIEPQNNAGLEEDEGEAGKLATRHEHVSIIAPVNGKVVRSAPSAGATRILMETAGRTSLIAPLGGEVSYPSLPGAMEVRSAGGILVRMSFDDDAIKYGGGSITWLVPAGSHVLPGDEVAYVEGPSDNLVMTLDAILGRGCLDAIVTAKDVVTAGDEVIAAISDVHAEGTLPFNAEVVA